ncbi:rhomboid family intramembrane serine protease [uncultured Limosilactobacillus sp.]|uniref:rhomboid family intramembrane serine protease n=1 Tax=uncultured Limosilactobacillus sp. TaxID=2837629 RepID=UPI0025E0DD5B|nr:rhomboid family intramembrane serine protease [uncultured Limosilactobacillus sp.]
MNFSWRKAPVTTFIIAACVITFVLMTLAGGSTDTRVLLSFGANNGTLVRAGQYWRLLAAGFLHIGFSHLLINCLTLYFIGFYDEALLGHWRVAVIFLISTIYGNLLSIVTSPNIVGAGASTGIFGLFGAFIMLGIIFRDNPALRAVGRQFIILVVFNLIVDVFMPGVDLAGHLGGLLAGFLTASVIGAPRVGKIGLIKRFLSGIILVIIIGLAARMGLQ